tara:strand:+ start:2372 stop:3412 length:1041 start_codon:yes stop_codon:yes gene_type:complete
MENFIYKNFSVSLEIFLVFIAILAIFLPFLIIYTNKFCLKNNLLDYPSSRKDHKIKMPISGGISLCLISLIIIFLFYIIKKEIINFYIDIFFYSLPFFFLGLIDDIKSFNTKLKILILIILISFSLIHSEVLIIEELKFEYLFNRTYLLYNFSIIFTVFCIFMFFNALNYSDGKNGISISYSLFIFFYLFFISTENKLFIFLIICALFIILIFNLNNKLFLGNSGVNFLSIFISFFIIKFYNTTDRIIFCDEIFILMFIPGLDAARVTIFRILKKKSAFSPDKEHFHHKLEKYTRDKYLWILYLLISVMPILLLKISYNFYLTISITFFIYCIMLSKTFYKIFYSR